MKRTDYAKIASKYDKSTFRGQNLPEPELAWIIAERGRARVLDVACGTGNWLAAQASEFGPDANLLGVDLSPAMLRQTRAKLRRQPLARSRAEKLPFGDGAFDLVTCRFAFHHFDDKPAAVDELARVLAPGGALVIANIAPEAMRGWWIYRAFPETRAIDAERFWKVARIERALVRRGFEVEVKLELTRKAQPLAVLVEEAHRRDASELAVLADSVYRRRLAAMERARTADPLARWTSEMAIVRWVALSSPRPATEAARSPRGARPPRRGRAAARG